MTMRKWHEFLDPILRVLRDGGVLTRRELVEKAADSVGLTQEDRSIVLATGMPMFENRIGWAMSHLVIAGALERPQRARYQITDLGRSLLAKHAVVTKDIVTEETGYNGRTPSATVVTKNASENAELDSSVDPEEIIDQGIQQIRDEVAADLLSRLQSKSPTFFEEAVVKLLVAMGYGGTEGRAAVTRQSNDGGIDGVIDQDTLGLNRVYVQAKRYSSDNSVQRPEIQAFVGALSGKADGGVFITTGRFSRGALEYADAVPTRIILIDGQRLTSLMIRFGVGVQVKSTVNIVRVDEDFFEQ
ncbi:restriction endonuclease [Gulosibacter sp. ACHW.36C]|uniref:Restriction endonuclease n=1 Tax=Gulosibacter sediminis TaxID=1729695 RepID=A0ABY4MV91_9MICO|nr:restriction endonuclease [Gulosibacter sediminis]UQN13954.1 restriction endonuclease [Gulosibacter sediminis]